MPTNEKNVCYQQHKGLITRHERHNNNDSNYLSSKFKKGLSYSLLRVGDDDNECMKKRYKVNIKKMDTEKEKSDVE